MFTDHKTHHFYVYHLAFTKFTVVWHHHYLTCKTFSLLLIAVRMYSVTFPPQTTTSLQSAGLSVLDPLCSMWSLESFTLNSIFRLIQVATLHFTPFTPLMANHILWHGHTSSIHSSVGRRFSRLQFELLWILPALVSLHIGMDSLGFRGGWSFVGVGGAWL